MRMPRFAGSQAYSDPTFGRIRANNLLSAPASHLRAGFTEPPRAALQPTIPAVLSSRMIVRTRPFEPDLAEANATGRLLDAISACVPLIGTNRFIEAFLEVVLLAGAAQCTIYAYGADSARCLLSRNFLSEAKGKVLAASYLDGWFRRDPLFKSVLTLGDGDCVVRALDEISDEMSADYLATFFTSAGLRTKTAVLAAHGSLRIALNLYRVFDDLETGCEFPTEVQHPLYVLIGRTVIAHFTRLEPSGFPLPLAALSERERQVCIGVLSGKKAEIIADEMGIGPSSVVTYRQRAYQKLGISSRGELFSLCRA